MTQICIICLQEKDETEFHLRRDRNRQPRRRRDCIACHRTRGHSNYVAKRPYYLKKQHDYYHSHPEEARAYQQANKERIAARMRRWRAENAAYLRYYELLYNLTHRSQRLAADNRYRAANNEQLRQRKHLYNITHRYQNYLSGQRRRIKNATKIKQQLRAWRQANPAAIRRHKALRYARIRGASPAVPISHRDIAERDGWRCHICGKKVTEKTWSLDHLIPLSKGGTHIPENVALAHFACNTKRNVGNHIPAQLRLLP